MASKHERSSQREVNLQVAGEYLDFGACPFEGCVYREWSVNKRMIVREKPDGNSLIAFVLKPGQKVVAETGVVATLRVGSAVVKEPAQIGREVAPVGAQVEVLHYNGEGFWKVRYHGQLDSRGIDHPGNPPFEKLKMIQPPHVVWWVRIRSADGSIGWTNESDNFDGKDAFGG